MPFTQVEFYRETDGQVPVLDWLRSLRASNARAYAKCLVRIDRLEALGHELRRPEADVLRDGIYELRIREGRVQYRILYFFHGRNIAILAHSLTKEGAVPATDIERALNRKRLLESRPNAHRHIEDWNDER